MGLIKKWFVRWPNVPNLPWNRTSYPQTQDGRGSQVKIAVFHPRTYSQQKEKRRGGEVQQLLSLKLVHYGLENESLARTLC